MKALKAFGTMPGTQHSFDKWWPLGVGYFYETMPGISSL